jgi:hypothetical protein
MSWRRLRVLIQHLPPESATMTAMRAAVPADELDRRRDEADPQTARWSQLEMLVARLVEAVESAHVSLLKVNGAKQVKDPPRIPRPGVTTGKKRAPLTAEAAEILFQLTRGSQ